MEQPVTGDDAERGEAAEHLRCQQHGRAGFRFQRSDVRGKADIAAACRRFGVQMGGRGGIGRHAQQGDQGQKHDADAQECR